MITFYMKRVAVYIDGSNLYHSAKKKFNCKVDVEKLCKKLSGKDDLIKINYYISPINKQSNLEMYTEQQKFFEKLKEIKNLKIILGRLEKRKQDGKIYFVEKATDVNLTLDLVLDAQANEFDEAFLISNDGDFSGAVKAAQERFSKKVTYVAIGNNKMISYHLKQVSCKTFKVTEEFIQEVKL